ncbi:hypothetical protein K488DRAFT_88568 [Vararia minispora EC-137]|uniref:Uncharacterized protein n=1 Tax=Vararia minispora EC-137 TaxID=1314806 RepID=A0ACB8QCT4_9AGAM|nr:hypothetical protein K488DRAFT_88568 [Vararia minispora EC-137]
MTYAQLPTEITCYLTAAQREHLKKSTRKLAKVLGATPMLRVTPALTGSQDDLSVGVQFASVRNHVAALNAASAPTTPTWCTLTGASPGGTTLRRAPQLQFPSTGPCKETGLAALSSPQTLLVRTAPPWATVVTPSSTTARRASFLPATPLSAYNEADPIHMEHERRLLRKRLSKLSRTLGQTVPPVLVVPRRRSVSRQRSVRNHHTLRISLGAVGVDSPRLSASMHTSASMRTASSLDDLQEETPESSSVYEGLPEIWQAVHAHRSTEAFVTAEDESAVSLHDTAPPEAELDKPLRSARPRTRPASMMINSFADLRPQRARSEEPSPRQPAALHEAHEELDAAERARLQEELPSRSGSRIAQIFLRKLNAHEEHEHTIAHRSERRQGWSGEWNAASVQDVIAKLRELK